MSGQVQVRGLTVQSVAVVGSDPQTVTVSNMPPAAALINDGVTSTTQVWSSSKTSTEIADLSATYGTPSASVTPAGTSMVVLSVVETPPTPQRYWEAGDADWSPAFGRLASAAPTAATVPPGAYNISEAFTLPAGMNLEVQAGATVTATAAMAAVVQTAIATAASDGSLTGEGVIDGNDLADFAVRVPYFARYDVNGLRLRNGHLGGIKLGDTAAPGRSAEANLQNLHIERTGALSVVAGSQGIMVENSGDGTVASVIVNSYDTGMYLSAGGNMMVRDVHAWTPPSQGNTTTGFEDHSNNSHYQQCHADTPSTYGWRLYGYQTTFVQCGTYINPTAGNATDNQVIGIKFEGANSIATIVGHFFLGGSASKRLAYDILAADGNYDLITVVSMPGQFTVNVNALRARLVGLDVRDLITSETAMKANPAAPSGSAGFGVQTAGIDRWGWLTDGGAETGGNVGSGYRLVRYADDGTLLGEVLYISRASGTITVKSTLVMNDAVDFPVGSTTGTRIGTASTQKLAFWGNAPIVQPHTTGITAGFTAGAGTAVDSASTFTGNYGSTAYTIGDIISNLKQVGILKG